jgi:hypothetical protein
MKLYLLSILMGFTVYCAAQDSEKQETQLLDGKTHEFRIDVLESLVIPALDVSYEYIVSKYSGIGVSVFINLNKEFDDYQKFAITPYYRQYLFNKKDYGARGFFVEGLLQYTNGREDESLFTGNGDGKEETWNEFGIGFALGQKWVSNNGFVIELSAGVGRNFGVSNVGPEFFFRGGVNIGYRL